MTNIRSTSMSALLIKKGRRCGRTSIGCRRVGTPFFRLVAPHMIDQADEDEIEGILEGSFKHELEEIAKNDEDLKQERWGYVPQFSSVRLKTEDLKTIIVQLRALG